MEKIKKFNIKKKYLFLVIIGLAIVGGVFNSVTTNNYKDKLIAVKNVLVQACSTVEPMVRGYDAVWSYSIKYDTYDYNIAQMLGIEVGAYVQNTTIPQHEKMKSGWVSIKGDFDSALQHASEFYRNSGITQKTIEIKDSIVENIIDLKNPPSKYKDEYELLISLYNESNRYIEYAIKPVGSYKEYSANTRKIVENVNKLSQEISIRME